MKAPRALRLLASQLYYEQLGFWRNPFRTVFTVGFSTIFLVFLVASGGASKTFYGVPAKEYYVPGFAAYGVMSACFNTLAILLVSRRETGLLKRLRLSPLPTWVMLASIYLTSLGISALQVAILLAVGRLAFHVPLPVDPLAFLVAAAIGTVAFSALGIAAAALVPNEEAAGPTVSIIFFVLLFLSGQYFPLKAGSGLAKVASWFPVRRLILAMFSPFVHIPGIAPWQWGDLGVIAIWGAVGVFVAARRFRFEPRRA